MPLILRDDLSDWYFHHSLMKNRFVVSVISTLGNEWKIFWNVRCQLVLEMCFG